MKHKNYWMGLICLLLPACLAQSQVQGKYDTAKEICQSIAATSVSGIQYNVGARNQALKSAFGACMRRNGFRFSSAKPAAAATNPQPAAAAKAPVPVTQAPAATAAPTTSGPTPTAAQPAFAPLPSNAATYQPVAQPARNFPPRQ